MFSTKYPHYSSTWFLLSNTQFGYIREKIVCFFQETNLGPFVVKPVFVWSNSICWLSSSLSRVTLSVQYWHRCVYFGVSWNPDPPLTDAKAWKLKHFRADRYTLNPTFSPRPWDNKENFPEVKETTPEPSTLETRGIWKWFHFQTVCL